MINQIVRYTNKLLDYAYVIRYLNKNRIKVEEIKPISQTKDYIENKKDKDVYEKNN